MNDVNGMNPDLLVAAVTFIIWVGLFLYLVRLGRKIKELQR